MAGAATDMSADAAMRLASGSVQNQISPVGAVREDLKGRAAGDDRAKMDQTELHAEAIQRRQEQDLYDLIDEPFERLEGEVPGHMIDMRPPLLRAMVASREYTHQMAHGHNEDAITSLVSRVAFLCLHFGEHHERVVYARITLSRAYLDVRHLPSQALHHALLARKTFTAAKKNHMIAHNGVNTDMMDLDTLLTVAAARVSLLEDAAVRKQQKDALSACDKCAKLVEDIKVILKRRHNIQTDDLNASRLRFNVVQGHLARKRQHTVLAINALGAALEWVLAECRQSRQTKSPSTLQQPKTEHTNDSVTPFELHGDVDTNQLAQQNTMVLELLHELGELHLLRGDASQARTFHTHALGAAIHVHGEETVAVAPFHVALAQAYVGGQDDVLALEQFECALRCYEGGVDPRSQTFDIGVTDDIPHVHAWLECEAERARTLLRLQRLSDALETARATRPLLVELHGTSSKQVAAHEFLLGNILLAMEKPTKAKQHLRASVNTYRVHCTAKHKGRQRAEKLLATLDSGKARATEQKVQTSSWGRR